MIASTPSGARLSPNSIRIRPRIGNAVIDNVSATNSANVSLSMFGATSEWISRPTPSPSANGRVMPTADTTNGLPLCAFRCWKSKSIPITKRSSTSPSSLSAVNASAVSLLKISADTPGRKLPRIDGPRIRPAAISPHTTGCPSLLAAMPPRRAKPMITASWISTCASSASVSIDSPLAAPCRFVSTAPAAVGGRARTSESAAPSDASSSCRGPRQAIRLVHTRAGGRGFEPRPQRSSSSRMSSTACASASTGPGGNVKSGCSGGS